MGKIVIHETALADWYHLVVDAQHQRSLHLTDDLQSYLVFLLSRFVANPDLVNSVLAEEFLLAARVVKPNQHDELRQVGDKCLLFAGLFPKSATRKHVNVNYFVDLGRSAYGSLSGIPEAFHRGPYAELEESFVSLMDVLQTIRRMDKDAERLNPLQAFELWEQTGSECAWDDLQSATDGNVVNPRRPLAH